MNIHALQGEQFLVADYLERTPLAHPLLTAGLVKVSPNDVYQEITCPADVIKQAVQHLDRSIQQITLCSSTCFFGPEEADQINRLLMSSLDVKEIRYNSGLGCNTLMDSVQSACRAYSEKRYNSCAVIYLECTPESFSRLQNYAFFSDVGMVVEVSNRSSQFILVGDDFTLVREDQKTFQKTFHFPTHWDVADTGELYTLNTFNFVAAHKYRGSTVCDKVVSSGSMAHYYGADPFLQVMATSPGDISYLHSESPPGIIHTLALKTL